MRTVAILGSGFGLYGYLPALIHAGADRIFLPIRYRDKFSLRPELVDFTSLVQWVDDEVAAVENADTVVLALNPDLQAKWVSHCLNVPNIKYLLLEKPLANSPDVALLLFEELLRSKKVFRIGYIFRFTSWGQKLRSMLANNESSSFVKLSINWQFLAHHFLHESTTWKKYNSSGGGVIRFYGIHLIALLREIGYDKISSSKTFGPDTEEIVKWSATFSGLGLPACNLTIDTKAPSNQFRILCETAYSNTVISDQSDPFDNGLSNISFFKLDIRISSLTDLCVSLWESSSDNYELYRDTILFWKKIENCTQFNVSTV